VRWCGGTLKGLKSKLGYLQRLGITAIWISPILKQVAFQPTYHGYGTQNYLDVDPQFGTRDELVSVVKQAHELGIYVILDIILNHSGNVWSYDSGYKGPPWTGGRFAVRGFNDQSGNPSLPFRKPIDVQEAWPHGGVWPVEFQDPDIFTQRGHIRNWDYHPEYLEGDFEDLKDVSLGRGPADHYVPSRGLELLGEVYKFWIAFADLDGFRIDTVKHMDLGASRWFASVVHEFAQTIGKENFYCIGEITGDRRNAFETLEQTGINAALGIADIPDKLEYLVKGYRSANEYFSLFRNSLQIDKGSHVWFRDKVVTVLDDHDQVRKGSNKARFCAFGSATSSMVASAVGLQAASIGIPMIYYGTEQMFDGEGGDDRYIRECMFGGPFGAFRSKGRHFFDENAPAYTSIRDILAVRKQHKVLRRGRQYLRPISRDGQDFYIPEVLGNEMRSVVAWSRILSDDEMLLALNTSSSLERVFAIVDARINANVSRFRCLYSTDPNQLGSHASLTSPASGARIAEIRVPPNGFTIWARS
jgi:glycosidase